MIRLPLADIRPGMRVARTIRYDWGGTMLQAGAALDASLLRKLRQLGFSGIYVYDDDTEDIQPYELMEEAQRQKVSQRLRHIFEGLKEEARAVLPPQEVVSLSERELADRLQGPRAQRLAAGLRLHETLAPMVQSILDNLRRREDLACCVGIMKTAATFLFDHAIEVSILSAALGRQLDLTRAEQEELTLGALLHDVGYVFLPEDALVESGPADAERERILRRHAALGYHFLRDAVGLNLLSAHVAYQHHEQPDGGGYPRGLKGDLKILGRRPAIGQDPGTIHRYAAIVAVPNAYASWTEPRPWRKPIEADMAYRRVIEGTGTLFTTEVVEVFLEIVPHFPLGSLVAVRSGPQAGYRGVVAQVRPEQPNQPVVRLLYDESKRRLPEPVTLDLAEQPVKIRIIGVP